MKNFRGIWNGMVFRPDLDSSKTRAIHQKPNSPKTQFPPNPAETFLKVDFSLF